MKELYIKKNLAKKEKDEEFLISALRPELNFICSNTTRACIIHLLVKSKDSNHTMRVEEIARRIGKRHSVVIYHLERLMGWKIVDVFKSVNYGNSTRRSLWGLNLAYPNLICEVYTRILKFFYTHEDLEKLCSMNKNVRI